MVSPFNSHSSLRARYGRAAGLLGASRQQAVLLQSLTLTFSVAPMISRSSRRTRKARGANSGSAEALEIGQKRLARFKKFGELDRVRRRMPLDTIVEIDIDVSGPLLRLGFSDLQRISRLAPLSPGPDLSSPSV